MEVKFNKAWTSQEVLNILSGNSSANNAGKREFTPGTLYFLTDTKEIYLAQSSSEALPYGGEFWGDDVPANEIKYKSIDGNSIHYKETIEGILSSPLAAVYAGPRVVSETLESDGYWHIAFETPLTKLQTESNVGGAYSGFCYISDYGLTCGENLKEIILPKSVTEIGSTSFLDCYNLEKIIIPNSVTSIGDSAFNGCLGLRSVNIPNSVTSIDYYAFSYCTSLTNIIIPNSVINIDYSAFENCSNLESITIGNSVTGIDINAFANCTHLARVTYKGTTYTSKSALTTALTNNGVTVGNTTFNNTALSA